MFNEIVLGTLVFILIVIIIGIVYIYFCSDRVKEIDRGTFKDFDVDKLCKITGNCAANNPASTYGRAFWRKGFLYTSDADSYITGSREIGSNSAIVTWGPIPQDYTYWALTGYLYGKGSTVPWASVGDSISSARVRGTGHICVIMTPNMAVYETLKLYLPSRYFRGEIVRFFPMYIPKDMYSCLYTYDILSRTVYSKECQCSIRWNVGYFSVQNIPLVFSPKNNLIPRSSENSETDVISLDKWRQSVIDYAEIRGYTIKSVNVLETAYTDKIPGGLNTGYQCVQYNVPCKADNRDTLYLVSQNIKVGTNDKLLVFALNHVNMGKSIAYSNISFLDQATQKSYRGEMTGVYIDGYIPTRTIRESVNVIEDIPPSSVGGKVAIIERIYVDPASTIGPASGSTLPAIALVVSKQGSIDQNIPPVVENI